MTIFLYISIIIINLYAIITNKYSKIILIISFIFIYIIFIGYGNISYGIQNDMAEYIKAYNFPNIPTNMEIGYKMLMKFGRYFGLDFFQFKAVVTLICFILIYKAIPKFAKSFSIIIILYLLFSVIADTERFRNFIATSIVIYSLSVYIDSELKCSKIKYIMMIIAASTIHTSMLGYLIFLFIDNKNPNNRIIRTITVITSAICIIILLNGNNIPFSNQIINLTNNERVINYITSSGTNLGFLISFISHGYLFLVIWLSGKYLNKYDIIGSVKVNEKKYLDSIYDMNKLMFVFLPLNMFQLVFSRFLSSLLILDYLYFSIVYNYLPRRREKTLYLAIIITVPVMWTLAEFFVKLDPDRVFIPFFTRNFILH